MIVRRAAQDRGHANHGWLDTWHSFSFADYYDPQFMGWGALRVINDDTVEPGGGFPTHGHRDMEIVSVVLEGALQHRDSMGNGTVIEAGEVQRMSAGTGVMHSEFNPSATARSRFLQIWIRPRKPGAAPSYEQKRIEPERRPGRWVVLASADGRDGSLTVNQDAALLTAVLPAAGGIDYRPAVGRKQYVQVLRGAVAVNGVALADADGARIDGEAELRFVAAQDAKFLLFDVTGE